MPAWHSFVTRVLSSICYFRCYCCDERSKSVRGENYNWFCGSYQRWARYLDIDTILTRSWQYQDFLSWQGIWQYQDFLILILVLNKALEEYWYWLLNPRQYQDILILKLILNKAFEEYWYWLLSPSQYQDILILKLILYKVLEEYWYCLRNHNQYQDILILFISLESQSCPSLWLTTKF